MFTKKADNNSHPTANNCAECTRKRLERLGYSTENLKWDGKNFLKRCDSGHWFIVELGYCPECAIGYINQNVKPAHLSDEEWQYILESPKSNENISRAENTENIKPEPDKSINAPPPDASTSSMTNAELLKSKELQPVNSNCLPVKESDPAESSSKIESNNLKSDKSLNAGSKFNIKVILHKTSRIKLMPIVLVVFGIFAIFDIYLLVHTFVNTTEASAPVPIAAVIVPEDTPPAQTPVILPDYLTYYNNLSGYNIDYPSSWKIINANGMHTVFADTENTNTEIDITREVRNYQALVNDLSSPQSGMLLTLKNGKDDSLNYSLFTQAIGKKVRHEYIFDYNPILLRIYCDYQSNSDVERNFLKNNTFIIHMIHSYRPDIPAPSSTTGAVQESPSSPLLDIKPPASVSVTP
jgi:hypothetical protein